MQWAPSRDFFSRRLISSRKSSSLRWPRSFRSSCARGIARAGESFRAGFVFGVASFFLFYGGSQFSIPLSSRFPGSASLRLLGVVLYLSLFVGSSVWRIPSYAAAPARPHGSSLPHSGPCGKSPAALENWVSLGGDRLFAGSFSSFAADGPRRRDPWITFWVVLVNRSLWKRCAHAARGRSPRSPPPPSFLPWPARLISRAPRSRALPDSHRVRPAERAQR